MAASFVPSVDVCSASPYNIYLRNQLHPSSHLPVTVSYSMMMIYGTHLLSDVLLCWWFIKWFEFITLVFAGACVIPLMSDIPTMAPPCRCLLHFHHGTRQQLLRVCWWIGGHRPLWTCPFLGTLLCLHPTSVSWVIPAFHFLPMPPQVPHYSFIHSWTGTAFLKWSSRVAVIKAQFFLM